LCRYDLPEPPCAPHNYDTGQPTRRGDPVHLLRFGMRPPAREQRGRKPFNHPPNRPRCSCDAGPPKADQKAGDEGDPWPEPQPYQDTLTGRSPGRAGYVVVLVRPPGTAVRSAQLRYRATPAARRSGASAPARKEAAGARAARSQSSPSCSIDRAVRATLGRQRRTRRPELRERRKGRVPGTVVFGSSSLIC
jgi:hypothetical protein